MASGVAQRGRGLPEVGEPQIAWGAGLQRLTAAQGAREGGCTNPDPGRTLLLTGNRQMLSEAGGRREKLSRTPREGARAHGSHFLLRFVIIKIYHKTLWHICPFPLRGRGTGRLGQSGLHRTAALAAAWGGQKWLPGGHARPWAGTEPGTRRAAAGGESHSLPCIQQSSGTWEGERKTENGGGREKTKTKTKIKQNKEGKLSLFCHPFPIRWR